MKKSSKYLQNVGLCFFLVCLIALSACNNKPKESSQTNEIKDYSPIEGSWELISSEALEAGGEKSIIKEQFKVFNDGYFSIVMFDSTGAFHGAGGGSYEVNDNTYKETFKHYSDRKYDGYSDWQEWKMEGDTLIFEGFKKSIMPNGKDVTNKPSEMFTQKWARIKIK